MTSLALGVGALQGPGRGAGRILVSSLIGTSVEFYDFYIYATAASLLFGPLFFPATLPSSELVGAYASFGIAFMARPLGGAVFGHFGDRIGRKATLVASLLLMGLSTVAIGLLPTYAVAGWTAPVLLCLMRFGQGLALGGEWTGAALMGLENAPPGWRARFAMFAPLGAPVGFVVANGLFLWLTVFLSPAEFRNWGWRVPFLASALLVALGLWIRINLMETKDFTAALQEAAPPRVPIVELMRSHAGQVLAGTFGVVACFSLYYTATAFALGYGTNNLGYSKAAFLQVELEAILFMAAGILAAGWLSDRLDPTRVLIFGCGGTILAGIMLGPMVGSGSLPVIFMFLAFSLWVMGFVNGPLGAWLPSLFPPRVRYTGTSVAFNVGGILGGAFSPLIEQTLAEHSGLAAVGFYLALTGGVSLIAFDISARRRALGDLERSERRYKSIFEQSHVSLFEVDCSPLQVRLREVRASGLEPVLLARRSPAFIAECSTLIRVADANDATLRILGGPMPSAILGGLDRFLVDPGEPMTAILAVMRDGGGRFERQVRLRSHAGRQVTAIMVVALPGEDQPAAERVPGAMIDVTDREQAKEALITAQEELARAGRISAIGAIGASIAHEVNQPVGAVVMSAQACIRWLRRDPPNVEAALSAAERVVRDGMRAGDIVRRTREQTRQRASQPEAVDLRALINEVTVLLDREFMAAATAVRMRFGVASATAMADRSELQQVLVNLFGNAMQAMRSAPEGGRLIWVGLEASGTERVHLSVRDQGAGIAGEHLPRFFDPFFTTKPDGMGMGLSICKAIVEAHGGTLIGRNHEDGGAVFEITLPMLVDGAMARPETVVA